MVDRHLAAALCSRSTFLGKQAEISREDQLSDLIDHDFFSTNRAFLKHSPSVRRALLQLQITHQSFPDTTSRRTHSPPHPDPIIVLQKRNGRQAFDSAVGNAKTRRQFISFFLAVSARFYVVEKQRGGRGGWGSKGPSSWRGSIHWQLEVLCLAHYCILTTSICQRQGRKTKNRKNVEYT